MIGTTNRSGSAKKQIEKYYLEEARRASAIFPDGELVPNERPDFLLHGDRVTIGIEVTELCREEPRAEAGRLAKVPDKAKGRYGRLPNAEPVDVNIAFSPRHAKNVSFNRLTHSLAEFVYAHRRSNGSDFKRNLLPEGYLSIGIYEPSVTTGCWHSMTSFDTAFDIKELLESRITEKNKRVSDYRRSVFEVWLLIINDRFLGPGEVYARPDHLAAWKFVFNFERVLLFLREAGGGGEVIELQRG